MPEVLIYILTLAGGVALLIVGGEALVRGAVSLAARLRVSPLLIGLTVVAFGTSAPELAFNVIAAVKDNDALSFGNIVGSNIANIGLVLGAAALIRPLHVHASLIKREMPIMIMVTVGALIMAAWPLPEHWQASGEGFSRIDGITLLMGFVVFMLFTVASAQQRRAPLETTFATEVEELGEPGDARPMWLALLLFFVGLGMLVLGGQLAESGATGLARLLGVSDQLIGLTIVAIATSLPELAVGLIAARRGQVDIAVGNVVGSNIFNILLVLGATATVNPVGLPPAGLQSMVVALVLALLLWPMSRTHGRMLSRVEGALLLLLYVGYLGFEVMQAVR
jgi:cation:H+ antiporter